jgi:exodeoxyribonuclease VII small subunit
MSKTAKSSSGLPTGVPQGPAAAPESFESALAELEGIVAAMESAEMPLAQSLAAYQRGALLLSYCQGALKDAQQQVDILEKGVLKPFAAEATDDDE